MCGALPPTPFKEMEDFFVVDGLVWGARKGWLGRGNKTINKKTQEAAKYKQTHPENIFKNNTSKSHTKHIQKTKQTTNGNTTNIKQ